MSDALGLSLSSAKTKLDDSFLVSLTKDPMSSTELKGMKADLDRLSLLLKSGTATPLDKTNASLLGATLKSCLNSRTIAEKAKDFDTEKFEREQAALGKVMKELDMGGKLSETKKATALKLKSTVKESLEILETRNRLMKRTGAKKRVSIRLEKNLEEARRGRNICVCFLVDCTASMQPYIDGIKTQIQRVVDRYKKLHVDSDLQFGFVGYRDFDDDRFDVKGFTGDVSEFISFVRRVVASGGGDECEDVVGGLDKVLSLDWESAGKGSSRVLIHIADAPAHGEVYNGGRGDNYATGRTPHGKSTDAVPYLKALRGSQVHYFFFRVNSTCDAMVAKFNEQLALTSKSKAGQYVDIQELSQVEDLADTVLKTFSSSVLKTHAAVRSARYSQLSTHMSSISEEDGTASAAPTHIPEPDDIKSLKFGDVSWDRVTTRKTKLFMCNPPAGMSSLQTKTMSLYQQIVSAGNGYDYDVKWYDESPFGDGACRWAYWGRLQMDGRWQNVVLKRFKNAATCHSKFRYMKTLEETAIAQFLADNYNTHRRPSKPVRFVTALMMEMYHRGSPEYFTCEHVLPPGKFEKFCDNAGAWNSALLDRSLLEFAKYTFDATRGYMMVTDLQGVDTGSEFVLTDPAIVCQDVDRFMETNMGKKGIVANIEMVRKLMG